MLYFAVLENKMKSCVKITLQLAPTFTKFFYHHIKKSDDEHLPSVSNWKNTTNGR